MNKIKTLFLTIVLFFLCFISVEKAQAHLPGQPPYFKVNGKYSLYYPVYSTSLSDFPLPQDIAPEIYTVGQTINFEFDITQMPAPPDVVKKTKFMWDYGDGTKTEGLKNNHSYSKKGSYVMRIMASYNNEEPQLLQTTFLSIVPNKEYKLPKAVIVLNGRQISSPLTDVVNLDLNKQQEVTFDGTKSVAPSSKIVSYFWDFGDGSSSTESVVKHIIKQKGQLVFPLLRIKDSDGFIADTYVQITNGTDAGKKVINTTTSKTSSQADKKSQFPIQPLVIIIGIVLIVVFFLLIR